MTYPEQTQDTVNQGQALPSPVLCIPYYPPYCTPWGRSSSDGLGWEGNRRESGTPVPYFCTTILGEDLSPPWLLGPGPRPKRMRKVSIDRGISEAFSLGSQQSIPTSIAHPASQVRLSSVLIHISNNPHQKPQRCIFSHLLLSSPQPSQPSAPPPHSLSPNPTSSNPAPTVATTSASARKMPAPSGMPTCA